MPGTWPGGTVSSGEGKLAVKILGGGVSGMGAAINLAKRGHDVDVFERRQRAGERYGGNLQGMDNWSTDVEVVERLKGIGIETNFDLEPLHTVTVANGSREVRCYSRQPICYLVRRGTSPGTLDQGLASQAADAGVRIHLGETISPGEADIVATGYLPGKAFGIVKGLNFRTGMEDVAMVVLGDEIAYRGYAYLLVSGGQGSLCVAVMNVSRGVDAYLRRAKEAFSNMVELDMESPRVVSGFGSFSMEPRLREGGRLYVGEAAGIQDLLWGFGIDKALTSGYLAARSIANGLDYEEISAGILGRLNVSLVNRFVWEALHFDDYGLIVDLLARIGDLHRLFHRAHTYTIVHRALLPIARAYIKMSYPHLG